MAEVTSKISVAVVLDDGQDSSGNPKTVNCTVPSLNKTYYDNTSMLSVIGALEPCLSKSINTIRKTTVSSLSAA